MKTRIIFMMMWAILGLVLSLAPVAHTAQSKSGDLLLAQDKKTQYIIAVAGDAIPSEQKAATELSEYLTQISGAQFVIKNENEVPEGTPQILIGAGKRVKALLPQQKWTALGTDGIVVKTVGKNLVLAGGRSRGTLYAVYSFLEDTLGVRWWTSTESTVPTRSIVSIPPQNLSYKPSLSVRETTYIGILNDPLFATRMKVNGNFEKQDAELGGHNTILGWCHTFAQLLPVETYFKDHPEWYCDTNTGLPATKDSPMPGHDTWQLCLSNEEARQELTSNALKWIRKNPEAEMISISQNDYPHPCACPADLALQRKEGSASGPLLHFVNAVAADIEKEFPNILVETLAYQHTVVPPRFERPRQNVVIRLCSIDANFRRPFADDDSFRSVVAGWKAIAPRLYFWDYLANFSNMNVPHPNMTVLGPNIKFITENNAIALFAQGDAETNSTGDFVPLRAWLVSHLMWNPNLDQRQLENEFLNGYYGAAAPHLRNYLDIVQTSFQKREETAKLGSFQSDYSYLSLDVMNQATRAYRLAELAVAKDNVLADRVQRERLALDNAWLLRYKSLRREAQDNRLPFEGPANPESILDEFVRTSKKYGLEEIRFNAAVIPVEQYVNSLRSRFQLSLPLPPEFQGLKASDVIDVQEDSFRVSFQDDWASFADDEAASNGKVVRMRGDHQSWAVQYWFDEDNAFLGTKKWRWYALIRVQQKDGAQPGKALSYGIYDEQNKKEVYRASKELTDFPDSEYQLVDLGAFEMNSRFYLWVAPPGRDDIEGVYTDRFILTREP